MTLQTAMPALLALALGSAALAHSSPEANTPADGATVAEVPEIAIAFDEPMRVISAALLLDGDEVEIERATGMDPVTAFRAAPSEALAPGAYEFEWRGMSADGHPMQGGFGFTVAD